MRCHGHAETDAVKLVDREGNRLLGIVDLDRHRPPRDVDVLDGREPALVNLELVVLLREDDSVTGVKLLLADLEVLPPEFARGEACLLRLGVQQIDLGVCLGDNEVVLRILDPVFLPRSR